MRDKPEILFDNDSIVALYKPSGLLSVPDRYRVDKISAALWILSTFPDARPLHRLDFETSGILLFCKKPDAFGWYSDQFENRSVSKTYLAITEGRIIQENGLIDQPLFTQTTGKVIISKRGKESQTQWKVLERFLRHTYIEANPLTGRTHQIRVHFASLGHPLLCDSVYGTSGEFFLSSLKGKHRYRLGKDEEVEKPLFSRTALHASAIEINEYKSDKRIRIESPLPRDMHVVLQKLKQYAGLKH
ncbi:MAG: RNA pseudouridine synthase [Saprospiraceae bacterium]